MVTVRVTKRRANRHSILSSPERRERSPCVFQLKYITGRVKLEGALKARTGFVLHSCCIKNNSSMIEDARVLGVHLKGLFNVRYRFSGIPVLEERPRIYIKGLNVFWTTLVLRS